MASEETNKGNNPRLYEEYFNQPEPKGVNQPILEFSPDYSPHFHLWSRQRPGQTQGLIFLACEATEGYLRFIVVVCGLTCSQGRTPWCWRWWWWRCPGCSSPGSHRSQWRLCPGNSLCCLGCGMGCLPSPWLGRSEGEILLLFSFWKRDWNSRKDVCYQPSDLYKSTEGDPVISRTVSTEMS